MLAASVITAGAVNVLRLWAVKDAGLIRVATRSPGSLSALFFLILTLVLLPDDISEPYINLGDRVAIRVGTSFEALSVKGCCCYCCLPTLRCVLLTKVVRVVGHREVGEGRRIAAR